jgi:hypothetical protein
MDTEEEDRKFCQFAVAVTGMCVLLYMGGYGPLWFLACLLGGILYLYIRMYAPPEDRER